jgi:hypothetical protein
MGTSQKWAPGHTPSWLAVLFARWLDVRFAVGCDAMIEGHHQDKSKAEVAITKPPESSVMALPPTCPRR